jgi:hypothetical protein
MSVSPPDDRARLLRERETVISGFLLNHAIAA